MAIIHELGKFEAEPEYTRAFWEAFSMNGTPDDTFYDGDTPIDVIILTDKDRATWPDDLSSEDYAVLLWEDSQGFVNHRLVSDADTLARIIAECESDSESDPNDCAECARSHGPHYTGPCEH